MTNRYYVVTGASSGIGYALCCHLAKRNKQVIALARNKSKLNELQAAHNENIHTFVSDLSTQEGRKQAAEFIGAQGEILGLVNNAATNDPVSLLQNIDLKMWHKQLAINLDAPIFLTKALLPNLVKNSRVINLTTGTTNFAVSGIAGYAMTKAALNVFTKYLSDELQDRNILVTAAHPGIVRTGLVDSIVKHADPTLNISKAQERFAKADAYLDVNLSAKFLCWLLLDADNNFYTGDIIGIYNKKYQALWHNSEIPSPYPEGIEPP